MELIEVAYWDRNRLTAHRILVVLSTAHLGLSLFDKAGTHAASLWLVVLPVGLDFVESSEWLDGSGKGLIEELQDQCEHCSNEVSIGNASIQLH